MLHKKCVSYFSQPFSLPSPAERYNAIAVLNSWSLGEFEQYLVTDPKGYRGLEAERVVLVINPTEYYQRQYLPEVMSRARTELIMICMGDSWECSRLLDCCFNSESDNISKIDMNKEEMSNIKQENLSLWKDELANHMKLQSIDANIKQQSSDVDQTRLLGKIMRYVFLSSISLLS